MAGENLPLVDKLLGHRRHLTTAGHAHLADDHLVEVAERVGTMIPKAMEIPIPGTGDDSSAKLAGRLRSANRLA